MTPSVLVALLALVGLGTAGFAYVWFSKPSKKKEPQLDLLSGLPQSEARQVSPAPPLVGAGRR
jgi:hypothetical protein